MKNKSLFFILIFLMFVVGLFSEQQHDKPNESEVVLVFSCNISPKLPHDFFKKYIGKSNHGLTFMAKGRKARFRKFLLKDFGGYYNEEFADYDSLELQGRTTTKNDLFKSYSLEVESSEFMSVLLEIPSDRKLILDRFLYKIGTTRALSLSFPIVSQLMIPQKTQYIYLGNFNYSIQGAFFDVKSLKVKDDFEKAEAYVKQHYGSNANLIRGVLREIKE